MSETNIIKELNNSKVSLLKKLSNITGIKKYPQICIDKENIKNIKTVLQNRIDHKEAENKSIKVKVWVKTSDETPAMIAHIMHIISLDIKNKSFTIYFESVTNRGLHPALEKSKFFFKDLNISNNPQICK